MKYIIRKFKIWRRRPFKTAVMNAFSEGIINSRQMHEIAARIDRA